VIDRYANADGVLRQFEVNALVVDALVRSIDRDCVPLVDDVPGFVSSRLIDPGTGKILWLTTFDREAPAGSATAASVVPSPHTPEPAR